MSLPTGPITDQEGQACSGPHHNPGDIANPATLAETGLPPAYNAPALYVQWPTEGHPTLVEDPTGFTFRLTLLKKESYPENEPTPYQLGINAAQNGMVRVPDALHTIQVDCKAGRGDEVTLARYLAKPGTRLQIPGGLLEVTAPGMSPPPRYYLTFTRVPKSLTPDYNIPLLAPLPSALLPTDPNPPARE